MLVLNDLYDQKTWLAMEAIAADAEKSLRQTAAHTLRIILCTLGLVVIAFVEYHMIISLFGDLVEETETAFTPEIMALTALVMILGFHAMASRYPDHFAVRFIRDCPKFFIPLYLIGISLIIGGLIYDRGLLSILSEGGELNTESLLEAVPSSWTDWFIASVQNPVAALMFSLGIGGLAVVNIFVADFLLHQIKDAAAARHRIIQDAQIIRDAYVIAHECAKTYEKIDFELADLNRLTSDVLAERQGLAALDAVTEELIKPKRFVINVEHAEDPVPFLHGGRQPLDLKSLKAAIAKIEAIDLPVILHWMTSPKLNSAAHSTTARKTS